MLGHPANEVVDLTDLGIPESPEEVNLESADVYEEIALRKALHFHNLSQLPEPACLLRSRPAPMRPRPRTLSKFCPCTR